MNHGSLFSGIGGFDLAAEWIGWKNVFNCEISVSCKNLLKHYWPNAEQLGDIKTTDFSKWSGLVDIITGGDPCQPHSTRGKRKGFDDDRYLWPEMLRAINEAAPVWIVNENVPGTISNGVLDKKIFDLENSGYSCWPPIIIPASATGADHKRERVWVVAYSQRLFQSREKSYGRQARRMERKFQPVSWDTGWKDALTKFRGMANGVSGVVDRTDGIRNAIVPQVVFEIFKAIEAVG